MSNQKRKEMKQLIRRNLHDGAGNPNQLDNSLRFQWFPENVEFYRNIPSPETKLVTVNVPHADIKK